jgi:hypothetical protein
MRQTSTVALFLALTVAAAAPLFAQNANDDPSKEPPAGRRVPAARDGAPQGTGGASPNEPSRPQGSAQAGEKPSSQAGNTTGGDQTGNPQNDRPAAARQGEPDSSGQSNTR